MNSLQLTTLHSSYDLLQWQYGDISLCSIYGAGCIDKPKYCFVFMNPTARNITSHPDRSGLRAPRIGFKQIWNMFYGLWFLSGELYNTTQSYKSTDRNPEFVFRLYHHLSEQWIYITNLAKCTQSDAKPLANKVFQEYMELMRKELEELDAEHIFSFGNQVSSILLEKNISVSNYIDNKYEEVIIWWKKLKIYPCYYPVGIGYRNITKATERIKHIISIWS